MVTALGKSRNRRWKKFDQAESSDIEFELVPFECHIDNDYYLPHKTCDKLF